MGLFAGIINISLKLPTITILAPLIAGTISIPMFIWLYHRPDKFLIIATITFICIGLVFPYFGFFTNSGSLGGFQYFLVVITTIQVMVFPRPLSYIILILTLLVISSLYVLEQHYPELIIHYVEKSDRFPDILHSVLIANAVVSMLFLIIKNRYETDRKKVTAYSQMLSEKNKELLRAKEEAEQAVIAKERFLSTMSHEIRTPLNAVVGISNLMSAKECSPEQSENIDILRFSSENLLNLIIEILDFNKMESGKLEMEEVPFHLNDLVDILYKVFKPKADENKLKLHIEIDENLPAQIIGDRLRISQVLSNLISNAIKFTPDGHVAIRLKELERDESHVQVSFSVEDTGIGIHDDQKERIFEEFAQADSGISRRFGGTGLGLAIVRRLVALMGSEIELNSQAGKGSVFSFSLRLRYDEKPIRKEKADTIEQTDPNKLTGKRILVVEDNPMNMIVVKKYLTNWHTHTEMAYNGEEAVKMCADNEYDLILMDIQMPVMDGYTATREIRKSEGKNARVPIIALTASVMYEVRQKVSESGMNDYVAKPFSVEELYTKIIKYTS